MPATIDLPPYTPFVEAICADPLAAVPRLVLADWLEETGRPGAARIRSWVATWPALEAAWERGRSEGDTWHEIPDLPAPAGALALVLAQRLALRSWPMPWELLASSWGAPAVERMRAALDEALVLAELTALGVLPDDVGPGAALHVVRHMMRDASDAAQLAGSGAENGMTRRRREAAVGLEYAGRVVETGMQCPSLPSYPAAYIAGMVGSAAYATTPLRADDHVDLAATHSREVDAMAGARRAMSALCRSEHWASLRRQFQAEE